MSNESASSESDSLMEKELNRRKFLAGAASQIAKHSLITVPTVALILNRAALPANAQSVYGRRQNNNNQGGNNNNQN